MPKEKTPAPPAPPSAGTAGVESRALNAVATTEMKLEAPPRHRPDELARPDLRVHNEVRAVLRDAPTPRAADDAAPAPAAPPIVSNAPRPMFDGAAGMNSGEVHKAYSDAQQRRHTSALDAEGVITRPGAVAAALSPEKAKPPPPPVPRLALGGASPGRAAWGGAETTASTLNHAANAVADRSSRKPSPSALRPPPFGVEDGHRFAGQKSSAMSKPANAWEARHLWSETAPKAPKGGFGTAVPGGAGVSSHDLSRAANVELKFDGAPARGDASPLGPRIRKPVPPPSSSHAGGGGGDDAAGLSSSKLYEIGVGAVNKFDGASPARLRRRRARASAALAQSEAASGRVPGEATGAAGLTSSKMAQMAISEMSAEQRKLSLLAAHAAHSRGALSPGGAPRLKSADTSFHGAAGVTSESVGREAVMREFVREGAAVSARQQQRAASPFGARHDSSGVAAALVVGGEGAVGTASGGLSPALGRANAAALAHGLSSRAIAIQKLVSRTNHGQTGGRRSASEPRRRPSPGRESAGSVIHGERYGDGSSGLLDHTAAGVSSSTAGRDSPAMARVAGRTSDDIHQPREERRLSRAGNAADSLRGVGGLGHYMTGGAPVHDNTRAFSPRRHSLGPAQPQSHNFQSSSSEIGGGVAAKAAASAALGRGYSPGRSSTGMRAASPSRNASSIDFGGGGVWDSGTRMVASSSAIGAHPASPVRGLRA